MQILINGGLYVHKWTFKGQCHEIFYPESFAPNTLPEPLRNRLYVQILLDIFSFSEDI